MKNIIVAGAGGFLGSSLIRRLIREDVHIWALVHHFKGGLPDEGKITCIDGNLDIDELRQLIGDVKCDLFYNFAWQGANGLDRAKYDIQINNIMLTLHYAELAHVLGCGKYLCTGTMAEKAVDSLESLITSPDNMMYGSAKLCSHIMLETYCKNIGLNFIWMQCANIYGSGDKTGNLISYTIERIKRGETASFGPAKQPFDFVYVDDLVEAIYRLGMMKTEKNFYYIGSGRPRILEDYLKSVGEICGRPDLIRIGERPDDGIRYSYDMMDNSLTFAAVGNYISNTFENHMKYIIRHNWEGKNGIKKF